MNRRSLHTLLGLIASAMCTAPLHAGGWEQQPNGEWQFVDRVTTTGFFTCGFPYEYRQPGACSANGNTLLLRSGDSQLTVTFTGLAQAIASSGTRSAPIALGTFSTAVSGGPFTMPPVFSENALLFTFTMILNGELGGTTRIASGYTARNRTSLPYDCCENFSTYTLLNTPGMPSTLRYGGSLYDNFAGRDIRFDGSGSTITARVGLIPEPSTYGLLATGLAGLGIVFRRRKGG